MGVIKQQNLEAWRKCVGGSIFVVELYFYPKKNCNSWSLARNDLKFFIFSMFNVLNLI